VYLFRPGVPLRDLGARAGTAIRAPGEGALAAMAAGGRSRVDRAGLSLTGRGEPGPGIT
jgi:hypothetical protein